MHTGDLLATLIFLNNSFGQKIILMMAQKVSDELQRYFCYAEDGVLPNNYPWSDFESLFGSVMNLITKA